MLAMLLSACGGKKDDIQETSVPAEDQTESSEITEKEDVTMKTAKDDSLRSFLDAFDTYTDGGAPGSMEYDYRDTISVRRLMDCLFGQRCCVNYSTYPVAQPVNAGNIMTLPGDSFSWAAVNIFHVPSNDVSDYMGSSPAFVNNEFTGTITLNENGVWWYHSDITIKKAEFDGRYHYVQYRRNHDDPSPKGDRYQADYYAILEKEEIGGAEYWTLYTHSSGGFNLVVEDKNLIPDEEYDPEIEMIIVADTPVTMRSGPSENYEKISSYSPGVPMMVIGKKGDWYFVHYYEHYGWMYSEFLAPAY